VGRVRPFPPTTPLSTPPASCPRIYALGLRNPWRCSHDHIAQTTVCGDVGQVYQLVVHSVVTDMSL